MVWLVKVTSGMAAAVEGPRTRVEQEEQILDTPELRGPSIKEEQVPPHMRAAVEVDGTVAVEVDFTKARVVAVQVM